MTVTTTSWSSNSRTSCLDATPNGQTFLLRARSDQSRTSQLICATAAPSATSGLTVVSYGSGPISRHKNRCSRTMPKSSRLPSVQNLNARDTPSIRTRVWRTYVINLNDPKQTEVGAGHVRRRDLPPVEERLQQHLTGARNNKGPLSRVVHKHGTTLNGSS